MTHWVTDLGRWGAHPAIVTQDRVTITYDELETRLVGLVEQLGTDRRLVLIEAKNELEPLLWYLACLRGGHPVMLVPPDRSDIGRLLDTYRPNLHLAKVDGAWRMDVVEDAIHSLHPDLAVMLSTSGSTGTAKFVRLSRDNITANSESIATFLRITPEDRAITVLPFQYSYGLSVLNSHFVSGATVVLSDSSVVDPEFWELFKAVGATSIAAVPYTFELLDRVGFHEMELPSLRYITSSGGKAPADTVRRYARLAKSQGWELFLMYGQTEATTRMAYLPPQLVEAHPSAVGRAIPGGHLELRDDNGATITEPGEMGELIYRGRNVMLGYATSHADLATGATLDELASGDYATFDEHGIFTLAGRKSRFVKLFGLRLGLDEIQARLEAHGHAAVVGGSDSFVAVATLDRTAVAGIRDLVCEMTTLPSRVVTVTAYDELPLLSNGKIDYVRVRDDGAIELARTDAARRASTAPVKRSIRSIRDAYTRALRVATVGPNDSFVSLGGDSLSYIEVEMALESALGYAPRDWHRMRIGELESLEKREPSGRSLETSVVLRAVSITMVVAGHIGLLTFPGSVSTLLAIAGFNFARFQLSAIMLRDSVRPAVAALARIVVPTVLYTLAITLAYAHRPSLPITLLFSNLLDVSMNDGLSYWFIELLVQLTLVMCVLLSFRRVRGLVSADPRRFGFGLLAVSLAMHVLTPLAWDTDHLLNRVPQATLWIFALGWCAYFAKSTLDRAVLSVVSLGFPLVAFDTLSTRLLAIIGLTLLLWVPRVPVPRVLDRLIPKVATASLYIYLTHFEFQAAMEHLGVTTPAVVVVIAVIGGVIVAKVVDAGITLFLGLLPRSTRPTGAPSIESIPVEGDAERLSYR